MHDYSSLLIKDSASIFWAKIKEFEEYIKEEKIYIDNLCKKIVVTLEKDCWSLYAFKENAEQRILNDEKQIKRFTFFRNTCLGKAKKSTINIEQIKENSDPELLLGKAKVRNQHTLFFNCIFHNEKSPSMAWYKKSKSFFCFGCNAHGDAIDLAMKLFDCDFKEACRRLS
jgi:hypothetical protein